MLYGWTSVPEQTKGCIPLSLNQILKNGIKTALWTVRFATVVGMLSNPVVQGGSMPCIATKCLETWG